MLGAYVTVELEFFTAISHRTVSVPSFERESDFHGRHFVLRSCGGIRSQIKAEGQGQGGPNSFK